MSSKESPIIDKNKAAGRVSFSPPSPVLTQSLQQEANKSNENNDDAVIEERAVNDEEAIIDDDLSTIITFHKQPGCFSKDCQHDHGGANNNPAPNSGFISTASLRRESSSPSSPSSLPATNTISTSAAVSTAATASLSSSPSPHDARWIVDFQKNDPSTPALRKLCSTKNKTYFPSMHSRAKNGNGVLFKFQWNFTPGSS